MPGNELGKEFSLTRFIAESKSKGLSRLNRFGVFFNYPAKLEDPNRDYPFESVDDETTRMVLLFCESLNVPQYLFNTVPIRTFGETREAVYDKHYDPIPMYFYVDTDLKVKRFFDNWAKLIQNPETRRLGYYNDYITDMHIIIFNLRERETYRIVCHECFPKEMGPIHMEHEARGLMKVFINMQIKWWTSAPINEYEILRYNQEGIETYIPFDPGIRIPGFRGATA